MPVYDAETCRTRHLADLDRGAATGHVPTALLSRWERALEDVTAWRFAPTPVHGDLTGRYRALAHLELLLGERDALLPLAARRAA